MPANVTTIDPRFISVTRWASETAWNLSPFATIPILLDEDAWQDFARYICGVPAINALNPPRPEGFSDARAWAVALNQTIQLLVLPL